LCGIINNSLKQDPLSGDVYIFINRRKDRIKLLVWDRDGFWLFYKRLEKGVFQRPLAVDNQTSIQLSQDDLLLILQGIDLNSAQKRPRYYR
jgi:transposase